MSLNPSADFYDAANAILKGLGYAENPVSVNLLVAWEWCEKPHGTGGALQWYNPLNTTQPMPESYSVNSAGVQTYPSGQVGIQATVITLQNGRYPQILSALASGNTSTFFAATGEMTLWGTPMLCIQQTYGQLPPVSIPVIPIIPTVIPPSYLPLLAGLGVAAVVGGAAWWIWGRKPSSPVYMSLQEERLSDFLGNTSHWHKDIDTHVSEELSGFLEDAEQSSYLPFDGQMGADTQTVTYFRNLLAFDAARGVRVRDRDLPATFDAVLFGAYDPDNDTMVLNSSVASEDNHALQTLAHETVHSLLHSHRCLPVGTPHGEYRDTYKASVEEIEADLSVAMLFSRLGLPLEMYNGEVLPGRKWRMNDQKLRDETDAETYNRVEWAVGVMQDAVREPRLAASKAANCPVRRVG